MTSRYPDVLVFHKGHALKIPHEAASYHKLSRGDDIGDPELARIRRSMPSVAAARAVRDCALTHTFAPPAMDCRYCRGTGKTTRYGKPAQCPECINPYQPRDARDVA